MEDLKVFDVIMSYGSIGAVAVYFMVKDWQLSAKLNNALNDFTIALNVLIKKGDN